MQITGLSSSEGRQWRALSSRISGPISSELLRSIGPPKTIWKNGAQTGFF